MLRSSFRTFTAARGVPALARAYSRITVVGRTGAAPELTTTAAGTEVIKYVVASDQSGRGPQNADGTPGQPRTNWFRVTVYARDMSEPSRRRILDMPTGTQVLIDGEPRLSTYPIEDGTKSASALTIVQRQLEILRRPQGASQSDAQAAAGSA